MVLMQASIVLATSSGVPIGIIVEVDVPWIYYSLLEVIWVHLVRAASLSIDVRIIVAMWLTIMVHANVYTHFVATTVLPCMQVLFILRWFGIWLIVIIVRTWSSTTPWRPRSLRVYESLLCLWNLQRLWLHRLRLLRRYLQIVSPSLGRVTSMLGLGGGRVLTLWKLVSLIDETPFVAFIGLSDCTHLSSLTSGCRLLLCSGRVEAQVSIIHLTHIASSSLVKLFMFLKLCLEKLSLPILWLRIDRLGLLHLPRGHRTILRLLRLRLLLLLLIEVALSHLLLQLHLLLLLRKDLTCDLTLSIQLHLQLLQILDVLVLRIASVRWTMLWAWMRKGPITSNVIVQPNVLWWFYFVNTVVSGTSCHGGRVGPISLIPLRVVYVLLLTYHLMRLWIEVSLGHTCRYRSHFVWLPHFARLYRIHGLSC